MHSRHGKITGVSWPRVSILLAAMLVCATACGAGDDLRRSLVTSAPPPPASAPSAVPESAAPDPDAPAGPCTGDRIAVSLGPPTTSGTTVSLDLIVQNTGTTPCVTQGFPLVVAVAGNEGAAVGEPALPLGERGPEVRLEPRAAAVAPLRIRDPSSYPGGCAPRPVRGLRVNPAGGTGAVFVPREAQACSSTPPDQPQSTIGTVTPR